MAGPGPAYQPSRGPMKAPAPRQKYAPKGDMRQRAIKGLLEKARKTYGRTGGTEAPNTESRVYGRNGPE